METKMTENLTKQDFLDKVYDFENESEWNYKGDIPCVIDFWAEWCGPCKMVAPVLEELSNEYDGKIKVYKVDTESEQELSGIFGIRSIPSMLFVPIGEKPQMAAGALPKESFVQAFQEVLGVEPVNA